MTDFTSIEELQVNYHRSPTELLRVGRLGYKRGRAAFEYDPLFISYEDVLNLTRQLTRNVQDLKEMLRRAAFNVYAHNRDDHSRNFAFLMEPDGTWRLAPAYDLTFSAGPGGEHTTLIADEGKAPTKAHLMALAKTSGIKQVDADQIVSEVREACARWNAFADQAGVPMTERSRIAKALRSSPESNKARLASGFVLPGFAATQPRRLGAGLEEEGDFEVGAGGLAVVFGGGEAPLGGLALDAGTGGGGEAFDVGFGCPRPSPGGPRPARSSRSRAPAKTARILALIN